MPSLPRRRDSALRRLRLDDVPPALVAPVREALSASADALAAMGIDDPRLDSEVMLAEATGWDRAELVANPQADLAPAAARLFGEMVRRRLRREPVAYIVGKKGVRRLDLAVDRRVLIPRPGTELLVEVALERPAPRPLADGLDAICSLLAGRVRPLFDIAQQTATSAAVLTPAVALEVGEGRAGAVTELLREAGFQETETRCDFAGIERVVVGRP